MLLHDLVVLVYCWFWSRHICYPSWQLRTYYLLPILTQNNVLQSILYYHHNCIIQGSNLVILKIAEMLLHDLVVLSNCWYWSGHIYYPSWQLRTYYLLPILTQNNVLQSILYYHHNCIIQGSNLVFFCLI